MWKLVVLAMAVIALGCLLLGGADEPPRFETRPTKRVTAASDPPARTDRRTASSAAAMTPIVGDRERLMSDLVVAFRRSDDPPQQRAQLRRALESSGPTAASWTTDAREFMMSLTADPQSQPLGVIECYRGGCRTTVHFANRAAFDELHQGMFSSTDRNWRGQIITSAPQTGADGSVDIEWLVLEPDEGAGT